MIPSVQKKRCKVAENSFGVLKTTHPDFVDKRVGVKITPPPKKSLIEWNETISGNIKVGLT